MSDIIRLPPPPEWMSQYGSYEWPELEARHAAGLVLSNLDYESQLAAIHQALHEHREADAATKREIEEIDRIARTTSGMRNQYAVDAWVDRLHASVYEDAARSMSALGMLAPITESIFYQAFQGIRRLAYEREGLAPGPHARWSRPAEDQWDCHFAWTNGRRSKNLVAGIMQLADATGLQSHLPADLKHVLEAIFEYRNKMFHHGFEWPVEERSRFAKRIAESGWPCGWFTQSSQGGNPWIFYMSDELISRVIEAINEIVVGIGQYCKERILSSIPKKERDT